MFEMHIFALNYRLGDTLATAVDSVETPRTSLNGFANGWKRFMAVYVPMETKLPGNTLFLDFC